AVAGGGVAVPGPAGVPREAAEAARDTLGGAVAVAKWLPDPLGAALLITAREAFAQAVELTAAMSAVILVALAVVAAVVLRRVGAGAAPEALNDRGGHLAGLGRRLA